MFNISASLQNKEVVQMVEGGFDQDYRWRQMSVAVKNYRTLEVLCKLTIIIIIHLTPVSMSNANVGGVAMQKT